MAQRFRSVLRRLGFRHEALVAVMLFSSDLVAAGYVSRVPRLRSYCFFYLLLETISMDYWETSSEQRAFDSLGLGFHFCSDFRLMFAMWWRLVAVDESRKRDIVLPMMVQLIMFV